MTSGCAPCGAGRAEPMAASAPVSGLAEAGKRPLVSVIVPHLDDTENLDSCLALLGQQAFPAGTIEIIVVDNGSKSGFEAICAVVDGRGTRRARGSRLPQAGAHASASEIAR